MLFNSRAFAIIILLIVLIISFIHLGVSITIVRDFHKYGDLFNRERDLSIFNIVISIVGILISVLGLIAVIARRFTFSKIIAFGCLLIGLCALASLIAAIAINFLGIDHISSRFLDNMKQYKDNANARKSIDTIQKHYDCCGSNMWLDWATVPLYTVPSDMNDISTEYSSQKPVTDIGIRASATSSESVQTTTSANVWTTSNNDKMTNTDVEAIVNAGSKIKTEPYQSSTTKASFFTGFETTSPYVYSSTTKKHTNPPTEQNFQIPTSTLSSYEYNLQLFGGSGSLSNSLRKKRQTQSNYGNIYGLPMSYTVALPQSCCTRDTPSTFNSLDSYCISNANNVPNSFHRDGCSNKIGRMAVSQALSIAFMNAFLVIFAFIAVSVLTRTYAGYTQPPKTYRNSSLQASQHPYENGHNNTPDKHIKTSVINPHTDYSIYQ
ncbi:hypothetical protein I4U23_002864 [Adineta vaga]|nr:hypothetical protein I4U23_002864 [Adineta vaga]